MKKLRWLLLLVPMVAFAAPASAPTEHAIVFPMSTLQARLRHEEVYEQIFAHAGDPVAAAYFKGRQDIYREMIAWLDFLVANPD